MSKFHINKHGVPSPCKATKGNCPLGGDEQHFNSQADAQAYADKVNEKEYGLIANVDTPKESKTEVKEKKLTPAQLRRKEKKEFDDRVSNVLRDAWGGDEDMVKHCLKNVKYVEMNGSIVDIGDSKPSINSVIWYDDETEAPEKTYETFYNYHVNKKPRHFKKEMFNMEDGELSTLKLVPQYRSKNLELATLSYEHQPDGPYREVTDEELEQINNGLDEVGADFEKRLETYYKRYNDKIRVSGYWANR